MKRTFTHVNGTFRDGSTSIEVTDGTATLIGPGYRKPLDNNYSDFVCNKYVREGRWKEITG